jgi:hypothetical protein
LQSGNLAWRFQLQDIPASHHNKISSPEKRMEYFVRKGSGIYENRILIVKNFYYYNYEDN